MRGRKRVPQEIRNELSHQLQEAVHVLSASPAEVAADLGCSVATYYNWIMGRYIPSRDVWPRIKEVLGVDVEKIVRG